MTERTAMDDTNEERAPVRPAGRAPGPDKPVCATCGTAFPKGAALPSVCATCADERQYVPAGGQAWTSSAALCAEHRISRCEVEPDLHELVVEPRFGIDQRALLVRTDAGNLLWDCLPMLDEETARWIDGQGGLSAIAISHPHFYGDFASWSAAFGDVPVYIHADDAAHVQHPCPALSPWTGETLDLLDGLRMIRCGGHFEGACALHWDRGAGVLLSSDTIAVSADRRTVSFMRSFPNRIPLDASAIRRILAAIAPYPFERIHGSTTGLSIGSNASAAVRHSAERYLRAIGATP